MKNLMIAAGAALALTACGGGESETANTTTTEMNMVAEDNMMMDANAMNGAMDANMAMDPATQNLMEQDMNTNAPDANLANGL